MKFDGKPEEGTHHRTQKQPKTGPGAEGGQRRRAKMSTKQVQELRGGHTTGHRNGPKQVQELRGDTPQDTKTAQNGYRS